MIARHRATLVSALVRRAKADPASVHNALTHGFVGYTNMLPEDLVKLCIALRLNLQREVAAAIDFFHNR